MSKRAIFYLQLEPVWSRDGALLDVRAARITQRHPGHRQMGDTALVLMDLIVDEAVFQPISPAQVTIEPGDVSVKVAVRAPEEDE